MKPTIQDTHYIVLHGWIVNRLGLTSDEALVYALIYGYKDGFDQPVAYIAQWLNASDKTARRIVQRLVAAGLLGEKQQNGKPTVYTCQPLPNCPPSQIVTPPNLSIHPSQIDTPHINNNIITKRDINAHAREEKQKEFQEPTIEEVADFCVQRRNGINAEEFYYFYESKGWLIGNTPMKNWQAAVISWEKKRIQEKSNGQIYNNGNTRNPQAGGNAAADAAQRKPYSRVQELANTKFHID